MVKPESAAYYSLNLIGAALAGYSSWLIDFMPFVVLEIFWVIVSAFGLTKLFFCQNVPRGKGSKNV
ncbi:MAG: hypothetical protein EOO01_19550 [Chitinophagaceae bacterium]|nr:MAG: hypothetical protein EOO01_19550 [Chitinophagaceae bacterium]